MERFRNFIREKGVVLVAAACILAAAAAGLWAVRVIGLRLTEDLRRDSGRQTPSAVEELHKQEEIWQQQSTEVTIPAKNVPQTPAPSASSGGASGSSGSASGSGTLTEPAGLQTESAAAVEPAVSACTQPVSGPMQAAFSGEQLVYNKTLADWRTHNGIDYGCAEGESVFAPTDGKVLTASTEGNWGGVVTLEDEQGRQWRLCGVVSPEVKVGERVTVGQKLGRAGEIPCESAEKPHLHLELREGEQWLDPAALMG